MNLNNKQSGFTIVEIMISMLLGLIMMVGVVSLVIGNKRSFQEQSETSRIQENARFAIQLLIEDIRMAGYVGCQPNQANNANVTNKLSGVSNQFLLSIGEPIEGIENASGNWAATNSSSNDTGNNGGVDVRGDIYSTPDDVAGTVGTDAITIRYFAPTDVSTSANSNNTTLPIDWSANTDTNPNNDTAAAMTTAEAQALFLDNDGTTSTLPTIAAIADCNSADIFRVTGVNAGPPVSLAGAAATGDVPDNDNTLLSDTYVADSDVLLMKAVRYYIGANIDTDGDGVVDIVGPSLIRYTFTNGAYTRQELISGVESMQILYGENRTAGPVFVTANNVSDWDDVTSVKFALLLRSEDQVGTDTDTNTYTLLGTNLDPADLRVRRRVFNATVLLRNRTT